MSERSVRFAAVAAFAFLAWQVPAVREWMLKDEEHWLVKERRLRTEELAARAAPTASAPAAVVAAQTPATR